MVNCAIDNEIRRDCPIAPLGHRALESDTPVVAMESAAIVLSTGRIRNIFT